MLGPDRDDEAARLAALLRWYGAMGVDAVVDPVARDRFAEPVARPEPAVPAALPVTPAAAATRPALNRAAPPTAAAATLFADTAVQSARDAAAGAQTLEALRELLDRFESCGLRRTASRLVFADGTPGARIMLVGEAPGAEEDRSGLPFVGRGGQLLDRMLSAVGLDRGGVYIANVVPWRPPGNRDPTPQEVATCLPFIQRQIALCDPDVLLLLGKAALQALTPSRDGIMKARGRWLDFDTGVRIIRAMPMLHPAYLLRQPSQKKLAWRDLRTLARELPASRRVAAGGAA